MIVLSIDFQTLFDADALDIKGQLTVGWNGTTLLAAIAETGWDSQSSLTASADAHDANVPSFDDLTGTELE